MDAAYRAAARRPGRGPNAGPDGTAAGGARFPRTGREMRDGRSARETCLPSSWAGHETTPLRADAGLGALYTLCLETLRCRPARGRRRRGAGRPGAGAADVARLGYVRQVVEEALRLYPPGASCRGRAGRVTPALSAAVIPARRHGMIPVYGAAPASAAVEEPDAFRPDRMGGRGPRSTATSICPSVTAAHLHRRASLPCSEARRW